MKRTIRVKQAWDCKKNPCIFGNEKCASGHPGTNHGIHNAEMHLSVLGETVELTLWFGTGWFLPETGKRFNAHYPDHCGLNFHTAFPLYKGQEPRYADCTMFDTCFIDTGYGIAKEPMELVVREGSDAAFDWLEKFAVEEVLYKIGE